MPEKIPSLKPKTKRVFRLLGKIVLRVVIIYILLMLILIALVQSPVVQNLIREKVVVKLAQKLNTRIEVGKVRLTLLGSVVIDHIFVADDQKDTLVNLERLKVALNPLPLFHKRVIFSSISFTGLTFNYAVRDSLGKTNIDFITKAFADSTKPKQTTPSSWKIEFRDISFNRTRIRMNNRADSTVMSFSAGVFAANFSESDLSKMKFRIKSVVLNNSEIHSVSYRKGKLPVVAAAKEKTREPNPVNPETVIRQIRLNNVAFYQYDSVSQTGNTFRLGNAIISPDTIDISKKIISLKLLSTKHIYVAMNVKSSTEKKDTVSSAAVTTASGPAWAITLKKGIIGIDSLRFVNMTPDPGDSIPYLARISLSDIAMNFSASYRSSDAWSAIIGNLQLVDDRTHQHSSLSLNTAFNRGQLVIRQLNFKTGASQVEMNGTAALSHLSKQSIPDFHLQVKTFHIVRRDIADYLPSKAVFHRYKLPESLSFTGDFSSVKQQFKGTGNLSSEMGKIAFNASFAQSVPMSQSEYSLKTTVRRLQVGQLLNDSVLGQITANVTVKGKGLNPDSLNGNLNIHIDSVTLAAKEYRNIDLDGSLKDGDLSASTAIADHGADVRLKIDGTISHRQPDVRIIADVRRLDLLEMGMTHDSLAFTGFINASYRDFGPGKLDAYTDTCGITIFSKGKKIVTHNKLSYAVHNDTTKAFVGSDFGAINYVSNIPAGKTAAVLRQYFGKYYALGIDTPRIADNQFLRFTMAVRDLSSFKDILPVNLAIPEGGNVKGELVKRKFKANVDFNQIKFNQLGLDSLHITANGGDSVFNVQLLAASFQNSFQTIRNIDFTNNINKGNMEFRVKLDNATSEPWFNIGVGATKKSGVIRASFKEPLMLNHEQWTVDPSNQIMVNQKKITLHNFIIRDGPTQIMLANTKSDGLALSFQNLGLSFISELLKGDPDVLAGDCNGNVSVYNLSGEEKTLDARIKLTGVKAAKQVIGDLDAEVSNTENPDRMNLNVNLRNNDMRLSAKGYYGMKDNPSQIALSTSDLNLASFGPLIDQYLTDPKGQINALLNVSGHMSKPEINGNINFKAVSFLVNALQAKFSIDGQRIGFDGNRVTFPSFKIKDETGNPLAINGNVSFSDLKNVAYSFDITSTKFLAYHVFSNKLLSRESKVYVTSNIKMEGKNSSPVVNAIVKVDEGSRIFYEMSHHSSDYSEEGVITFIGNDEKAAKAAKTSLNLKLTANVTIAGGTPIAVLTDPAKGDMLTITSGGTFSIAQDAFQFPRMIGKVDISGGSYTLTLAGFKKTFTIMPNSSINWTGNLARPEFDLKAYYEIRSSPEPLYAESQASSTQVSGAIPFRVQMNITGSLASPTLTFEITLPDEYQNSDLSTILQQVNSDPSRVNREAMSLLLFGTFDIESIFSNISLNTVNSMSNSGGTNALISRAMNQFAAHEIKFVDLNFDLSSFDEYGTADAQTVRTELKVEAAKKLVNNRLNARGGATFVLQADEIEQSRPWYDKVTPELNVEYLLNRPKTWSIRVFRQNEYRGLVEGKVVNTGAGVLFQKDFDTTRELFTKPKEDEVNFVAKEETE